MTSKVINFGFIGSASPNYPLVHTFFFNECLLCEGENKSFNKFNYAQKGVVTMETGSFLPLSYRSETAIIDFRDPQVVLS